MIPSLALFLSLSATFLSLSSSTQLQNTTFPPNHNWWELPPQLSSFRPNKHASSADVALAIASTMNRFRSHDPKWTDGVAPRGSTYRNPNQINTGSASTLAGATSYATSALPRGSISLAKSTSEDSMLWNCRTASDLSAVFDEISASLAEAQKLANSVTICRKSLRDTIQMLAKAEKNSETGNVAKARNKISWALTEVQVCGQEISTETTDKGQNQVETGIKNLNFTMYCLDSLATDVVIKDALTGTPMETAIMDYGPSNVIQQGNNYFLNFDPITGSGARVKSAESFSSGRFSANITCPPAGFTTAFYLASDSFPSPSLTTITMEFPDSNRHYVKLSSILGGVNSWTLLVPLDYDCSLEPLIYTIFWTPDVILWKVDNKVLHMYDNRQWVCPTPYPGTLLQLYLSLSSPSSSIVIPTNATSTFNAVSGLSPLLTPPSLPAVTSSSSVYPLGIDYCAEKISILNDAANITFDQSGCGGRFRTTRNYQYGEFSGEFKCSEGNTSGALSSLYLSSMEGYPEQDEIDFEWLGYNKMGVQTNYYVNGVGGNEVFLNLDFDCSEAFHKYTIRYTNTTLTWLVDDEVKRVVQKNSVPTFPVKPVFLYASLWNASFVIDGGWTGPWSDQDLPHLIQYRNLMVSPWRRRTMG